MAMESVAESALVNSELLCFVTEQSKLMTVDHLVKVCRDFYSEGEIVTAR